MKTFMITKIEKVQSNQIIEANSKEEALEKVKIEGTDQSTEQVIGSANFEIEEVKEGK